MKTIAGLLASPSSSKKSSLPPGPPSFTELNEVNDEAMVKKCLNDEFPFSQKCNSIFPKAHIMMTLYYRDPSRSASFLDPSQAAASRREDMKSPLHQSERVYFEERQLVSVKVPKERGNVFAVPSDCLSTNFHSVSTANGHHWCSFRHYGAVFDLDHWRFFLHGCYQYR